MTDPTSTPFVLDTSAHELGPRRVDGSWLAGPANVAFRELATTYCKRHSATNNDLATALGITPQACSNWKSGSGGRRPSFASLVWLCEQTNSQIVLDKDGMHVKRRRKRSK